MMLTMGSTLRVVFTVFAIFWTVVIAGLLVLMGPLTRKQDGTAAKHDSH